MLAPLLLAWTTTATAHGLDAHRVQVELEESTVRVAASPGVDAFPGADVNGDARLDRSEVAAARADLRARFVAAFVLEDGNGARPTCDEASVSTAGEGGDHVRVSLRCTFPAPPDALSVEVGALGFAPYTVEGVRTRQVRPGTWAPEGGVVRGVVPVGGGRVQLFGPATEPTPASPAGERAGTPRWAFGAAALGLAGGMVLARTLSRRRRALSPPPVASQEPPRDPPPPA